LKKRTHSSNRRRKKTVAERKAAYARCVAAMPDFRLEPRFTDPNGRRWIDETEYLKHLEERAWLAAKFGHKDEYADGELEAMFNDPQLNAILDKVEEDAASQATEAQL
jgi:hypothetical protein